MNSTDMSQASPPALGRSRIVTIRREGGLAHFPGLSAPRLIDCGACSEGQRRWLERLLGKAAEYHTAELVGADRRAFHIDVALADALHRGESAGHSVWRLVLAEEQTPAELVTLWQHGTLGEA